MKSLGNRAGRSPGALGLPCPFRPPAHSCLPSLKRKLLPCPGSAAPEGCSEQSILCMATKKERSNPGSPLWSMSGAQTFLGLGKGEGGQQLEKDPAGSWLCEALGALPSADLHMTLPCPRDPHLVTVLVQSFLPLARPQPG